MSPRTRITTLNLGSQSGELVELRFEMAGSRSKVTHQSYAVESARKFSVGHTSVLRLERGDRVTRGLSV